jgi:hypothetical protein
MARRQLHVLFGGSGAFSVRQAIERTGRTDGVICFHDFFEFGPISPPDPMARAKWVDEVLGVADWEEVAAQTEIAMTEAVAADGRFVAWVSRRDAHWYSGFLEWLSRIGDKPCDMIDVTELMVITRRRDGERGPPSRVISPSVLAPDQIIETGLMEQSAPLTAVDRDQYRALWTALRAENAPLRIVGTGGLVSAPITIFDSLIKSSATNSWGKMARVLGEALVQSFEGDFHPVGDLVLAARIRALAEAGDLEWRGDLYEMRNCEIRLPA